jgi:cyanophycinase
MTDRPGRLAPGPLALVGGEEFLPGNEAHDALLVEVARRLGGERRAFIVASAAARQGPDRAVETARRWFARLGLDVEELPLRTRAQARNASTARLASRGSLFYLTGGDPGLVVEILAASPAWAAILEAWRAGAALAGSSAGAMALGQWTLIRARMPGDTKRDSRPALGVVPGLGVVPHFSDFGRRWVTSAQEALAGEAAEAGGAADAAAQAQPPMLLGIDARTAVVWREGEWCVMGSGGATVFDVAGDAAGRTTTAGAPIEDVPQPRWTVQDDPASGRQ